MIHYATFEGFPCIYTETHAWAAYAYAPWKEWSHYEVMHNARVLTEAAVKQRFPHAVIPKAAFQAGE